MVNGIFVSRKKAVPHTKCTQTKWQYFRICFEVLSGSAKIFLHALLGQKHLFRILLVSSILPCLPLQESTQLHYISQIQGNRFGFQFSSLHYQDRHGEKMGRYVLEQPYTDFLCHTMIRTVTPGFPLVRHLVFPENYRAYWY